VVGYKVLYLTAVRIGGITGTKDQYGLHKGESEVVLCWFPEGIGKMFRQVTSS
jgi:hypothetical protein